MLPLSVLGVVCLIYASRLPASFALRSANAQRGVQTGSFALEEYTPNTRQLGGLQMTGEAKERLESALPGPRKGRLEAVTGAQSSEAR